MRLGLAIDLDTCVGCHGCATACKQWNSSGTIGPLTDEKPYGKDPQGSWLNRIRTYEVKDHTDASAASKTLHMPMSCMHCDNADCVTVCPTGASYKRDDGIVMVDQGKCMGCNLCAWACPYGARELDAEQGTMKKCTLCVDRIYDERLPEEERKPACVLTCPTKSRLFGDFDDPNSEVSIAVRERSMHGSIPDMLPDLGYNPVNTYLPPRNHSERDQMSPEKSSGFDGLKNWINKVISH